MMMDMQAMLGEQGQGGQPDFKELIKLLIQLLSQQQGEEVAEGEDPNEDMPLMRAVKGQR